tara:strand:+ start:216 stop:632 length:417 start_codon:yes stop_codon:yes gene_type:complete
MALSTDYTWGWEITQIRKRDQVNSEGATLSGAVVQTYWKLTGTDADGDVGEFSGATPLDATMTPAGSFTAFADLTEASVLGWVQSIVLADQGYCDHIKDRVQGQIEEEQTADAAMPWGDGSDVTPVPEAPLGEDDGGE